MASPMQSSDTPPSSLQSLLAKYVDKEQLENEFLYCEICFEKYDQNMRSPKLLPCSHTFCAHCLQTMVTKSTSASNIRHVVKCPFCCTEHPLTKGGLRKLPTDSRIVQMIDFLSAADEVTPGSICSQMHEPYDACHQHPTQALGMFCKTCKVLVCKECVAKSHSENGFQWLLRKFKEADSSSSSNDIKRCEVTDFAEAFMELKQKTASIKDRTERVVEGLRAKSDSLEKYSKELKDDISREEESINRKFAEYQQILDQRRQELLVQLKTGINNSQHMMQKRMFEINSKIPAIIQLQEEFEDVKKGKSFWKLRSVAQRMEQWENSAASLVNCSDHDYRRCLYDTKHSDLDFPSQVKGLGDVIKTSW